MAVTTSPHPETSSSTAEKRRYWMDQARAARSATPQGYGNDPEVEAALSQLTPQQQRQASMELKRAAVRERGDVGEAAKWAKEYTAH